MFISLNSLREMSLQNIKGPPDLEESQFQPVLSNKDSKQCQEKLEQLVLNLQKMQAFIEKITEKRVGILNNIIYNFCGKYEKMPTHAKNVISLLEKRIERMMKNKKIKKNWSEDDLDILIWTTTYYAELHEIQQIENMTQADWYNIAQLIPGTTAESCMFKILGLKKVRLSEQSWTAQESNLLYDIVTKSEKVDWKKASQQLFRRNQSIDKAFRSSKQCKEHWSCYLNPHLKKGPWMIDQDILLLDNILQNNGKKRWTELAKIFQGRTQNALKNRFCLLIDRQKSNKNQPEEEINQIGQVLSLLRQQRKNLVKLNVLKDEPYIGPQTKRIPIPQNRKQENPQQKAQKTKEIQHHYQKTKKSQLNSTQQFNVSHKIQHKLHTSPFKNDYKFNFALKPEENQQKQPLKRKCKKLGEIKKQKQVPCTNKHEQPSHKGPHGVSTNMKTEAECSIRIKIEPTQQIHSLEIKYPYNTQTPNFFPPFFYNQYFMMFNPMLQ